MNLDKILDTREILARVERGKKTLGEFMRRAEDVLQPDAPKKNITVIGDAMIDVYVHGRLEGCQDGCPKFVEDRTVDVVGGCLNAARSLEHSGAEARQQRWLVAQKKTRFLDGGKIVFRHDSLLGPTTSHVPWVRDSRRDCLQGIGPGVDGVYVADYDKGMIDDHFMQQIVAKCQETGITCVVDPKRDPKWCMGAVLKCNGEFAMKWCVLAHSPGSVITHGHEHPTVFSESGVNLIVGEEMHTPVHCVNHVGAGDCFGAWLTLGLAHGLRLQEAVRLAHGAGRVYVQHHHNRPPWPHEIRKELDPVAGKVLVLGEASSIRRSCDGRIVFTNGMFRIPHAGHSWLLNWAKQQGDVLVVGINDSVSAFRCKPGEFCLPLEQRVQMIATHQAVDYVAVFSENTPVELVRDLEPDLLVKGGEYQGQRIPGDDLCEAAFAPPGPFKGHVGDLIAALRG